MRFRKLPYVSDRIVNITRMRLERCGRPQVRLLTVLPVPADTIHTVINTNWEPVMHDIAPAAFQHIILACVNEVKKLFQAVPAKELLRP